MSPEERKEVLALLEAYEPLLTKRQQSIMDSYFRYDLSLGEISEMESISRAGALDAIRKSIEKLQSYESKCAFVAFQEELRALQKKAMQGDEEAKRQLEERIEHGI